MATRYVKEGGNAIPPYENEDDAATNLDMACTGASNGDTILITGTWTAADTTQVDVDANLTITAQGSAKQPGYPNRISPTHYRHEVASGHAFVVSANLTMNDVDVRSSSAGTSDELFRVDGGTTWEFNRCLLGFDIANGTDQQDGFYTELDTGTLSVSFNQCMFYSIGRSIASTYNANTTLTANFNSCHSYNCGHHGGRSDGIIVGSHSDSGANVRNINVHHCLFHVSTNASSRKLFGFVASEVVTGIYENMFTSEVVGNLSNNVDNETATNNCNYAYSWTSNTDPGAGNFVIVTSTTAPYDLRLVDDADSGVLEQHSDNPGTDTNLDIPATDIVGTARSAPYDVGPFRATAPVGGPASSMPVMKQQYMRHL